MKRVLLTAGALAVFAFPATAADLARPVYRAPVAVPVYNWTGFYIGVNAGWGRNSSDFVYVPPGPGFTGAASAYSTIGSGGGRSAGFIGGGQLGYNLQWNSIVLGVEADIDSFHRSAGFSNIGTPPANVQLTSVASVSTDWLATVRGRVGVAVQSWLFYFTAGGAATKFNFNQANNYDSANIPTELSAISETRWAVVYGGGIEYLVGQNWTVRAEYLHADFGTASQLVPLTPVGSATLLHSHSVSLKTDIVRAALNYKFGYDAAPAVYK